MSFFELCSLSQLPASQLPLAMACPAMDSKGRQHQGQENVHLGIASPGAPLCLRVGQPSLMHVLLCLCRLLSHRALALLRLPVQQGEVLHVLALFRLQGQQDQVLHALDLLQLQGQPEQALLPRPMAPRLVSSQFAAVANYTSRGAPYPSHDRSPNAARSRTSCARPGTCHSKMLLLRPLGQ